MPLSAHALAPPIDLAANPGSGLAAADHGPVMRFAGVAITETQDFPPAPAAVCWVYLTLNAEIVLSLPDNPTLQTLVQLPRTRVSVDGQWPWWALRRKYPRQALRKLSGSDLIYELADHCAREGRRLLLLGSQPEVNARAVMRLRELCPGLPVAGYAPGPYRADGAADEAAVNGAALEAIQAFGPDYVVLGLGANKEQRLCLRLAPVLDGRVTGLLCFGGAIDTASGRMRRAPRWMQHAGLEALFRVLQRPQRLARFIRVQRILPGLLMGRY
jgi:N-acetylglucosaminyldiphosphoundecaprenol N-acetyl-beta-D-mannosaminyltransferase